MEFKNETGSNVKYRLGSYKSGFVWHTIRPEEIVDIPEHSGESLNLTPLKETDVLPKEKPEDPKDNDATFQEGNKHKDYGLYKKKLIEIDGIGKKTAEDIIKSFPTEESLIDAVKNKQEVHKRDDVDAAIKEIFGD